MYNSILKTFVYVAEEGSFNKAASLLYISSVAVKKQMDQLEKQLGITLFNKTNAGTTLNDAGKELYDFTKKYIEESDNEIFYLKDKYSSNILNINIANPLIEDNSIKKIIFSKIKNMKYNIKINPYIPFNNKEEKIIDILNEDNDFIIAAYSKSINSKLEFVPIKKFKMTCVVFKDDKLSKKKALNLENLNNKNIYLWRNDIYQVSDDIRRDLINLNLSIPISKIPYISTKIAASTLRFRLLSLVFALIRQNKGKLFLFTHRLLCPAVLRRSVLLPLSRVRRYSSWYSHPHVPEAPVRPLAVRRSTAGCL